MIESPWKGAYAPMVISVALTGAVPKKEKYGRLPTSPQEIADEALACAEAGASTVHIHMRDEEGNPSQSIDLFAATISRIRAGNPDLIICATTTSRGSSRIEDRLAPLQLEGDLKPDMASLTLGSYNTPTGVNLNPEEQVVILAEAMAAKGISVEAEIFEVGMLYSLLRMVDDSRIRNVAAVNLLFGVQGAVAANAFELSHLVALLPPEYEWATAGIGHFQRPMTVLGAVMGGNVRVGMEDDPRGDFEGWSNVDAVLRAVEAAKSVGREVASISDTRIRFGLAQSDR